LLYLSKIQRLTYMVSFEDNRFCEAIDGSVFNMPGTTVGEDLGQGDLGCEAAEHIYAADKHGNLFVLMGRMMDVNENKALLEIVWVVFRASAACR
jgi:hypothetical protein